MAKCKALTGSAVKGLTEINAVALLHSNCLKTEPVTNHIQDALGALEGFVNIREDRYRHSLDEIC